MARTRKIGVVLWILVCLVLLTFYIQANEPLRRSTYNFLPLIVAFVLLVSTCGIGSAVMRVFSIQEDLLLELTLAAAFGLGINAILVFTLGVLGIFQYWLMVIWFLTGLILFAIACIRWSSQGQRVFRFSLSNWDSFGLAVIAISILFALPHILCPETSTDALAYHLLVPKIYLSAGKISFIPLLVESNYPGLAEYNYMAVLSVSNEIACKCFHFLIGLLVLVAVFHLVKKCASSKKGGLLASALFISMPVVTVQLGWAWNDFFYTLFILMNLYFLISYDLSHSEQRKSTDLLFAGIMAGLAAWTKYTFLLFFPVLCILAWIGAKRWQWKQNHLIWLFAPIFIFSLPWILKNWLFTGNPFYPFLNSIFQSPYWSDASNTYLKSTIQNFYIREWHWYTYFLFPFQLMLTPRLADIHTGLMPLILLPALMLSPKPQLAGSNARSVLLIYLFCTFIFWLALRTGIRTMFPLFAVLFVLTNIRTDHSLYQSRIFKVVMVAVLILNVTLAKVNTDYLSDPFRFFIGLEDQGAYLKRMSRSQLTFDYLNHQPPGNVLLIGIHEPLYLRQFSYFSGRSDTPIAEALQYGTQSTDELAAKLKRLQIRYISINLDNYQSENSKGLYTWSLNDRRKFERMISTECKIASQFGREITFEWKSLP